MKSKLLERILIYKKNPDVAKPLTIEELTTAFADLFSLIKSTNIAINEGKMKGDDGYTPKADIDFMSMKTAQTMLESLIKDTEGTVSSEVKKGLKAIDKKLSEVRDGLDAEITDAHLDEAARRASLLVEMPDFSSLITAEPTAIRNALELLSGDERIDISAVKGWTEELEKVRDEIQNTSGKGGGGGLGTRQVRALITKYGGGAGITDGDKGDITVSGTGTVWDINADTVGVTELSASGTPDGTKFLRDDNTWVTPSGSGDVVGPASAVDSNFAAFDTTTGKLIKDSGSAAASFATASHSHTLTDVTDSGALAALNTVGNTEIDDGAVTFAKLQDINTNKLLGRDTTGTGDVEEISVGTGLEFSGGSSIQVTNFNTLFDTSTDTLDDIPDGTTYKLVTAAEKTVIGNTSGTNSGDNATNTSCLAITGGTLTGTVTAVAGTTTVAPIKMQSGTNLTTPEAGAFEYDGTDLFFSVA